MIVNVNFKKHIKLILEGGAIRSFFRNSKIFFWRGAQSDGGHKKIEYGKSFLNVKKIILNVLI